MKLRSTRLIALAAAAALFAPAGAEAAPFINEVFFNPASTDTPNEYVELRGTANAPLTGIYLIFVEGDAATAGDVQNIFDLTSRSFGSNGFLTLRQGTASPYSANASATNLTSTTAGFGASVGASNDTGGDIENVAFTAMLVNIGAGAAPTLTQDLDADNNGLDALPTGWTIVDSVALLDGAVDARGYGPTVFSHDADGLTDAGVSVINVNFSEIEYVARFGDSTGTAAADWVVADTGGTTPTFTINSGTSESSNPAYEGLVLGSNLGSANPVPEPASAGLVVAAAMLTARRRRRAR